MSNIIVMAFSPRNIVGCLLKKKSLQRGGQGHPRTPLATPLKLFFFNMTLTLRTDNILLAIAALYE